MSIEVIREEKPLEGKALEQALAAINPQGGIGLDFKAIAKFLKDAEGSVFLTSTGLTEPAKGIVKKVTFVEKP